MSGIIDEKGFRKNVGIVIIDKQGHVFWGERYDCKGAWQFVQGGIDVDEDPMTAMYRELSEEVGLAPQDVEMLAETKTWLEYTLPKQYQRGAAQGIKGQIQKWFLVKLVRDDDKRIILDKDKHPEFRQWKWVDYWYPVKHVIEFKRAVYQALLEEFSVYVRGV
jgi:putative (di)nucleoside polyphosphate hydrolase